MIPVKSEATPTLAVRLLEAADRVVNHCFNKPGDSSLMSIPARPGYDLDLLLCEAADSHSALLAQNAELVKALENLIELYALPGESNVDRFERVAQIFLRETGLLAPGKDESAASGGSTSYEERCERWEAWYAERAANARAALAGVTK